jgi:hypothetical protein
VLEAEPPPQSILKVVWEVTVWFELLLGMEQVGGAPADTVWIGVALSLRDMVQVGDGPRTFEALQEMSDVPLACTRLGTAVMLSAVVPVEQYVGVPTVTVALACGDVPPAPVQVT